ncbi:MAG: zinc-dependent alcohol dehydrogenase [Myxococcota bacterium]
MKALVFHKPKDVRVEDLPDPRIEAPTDVIVRVTTTTLCGSDLHIYNGYLPQPRPMALGHEFMGVVEAVGADVRRAKVGDRVLQPFCISCGSCWFCARQWPTHCEQSNPKFYGPDGDILKDKGAGLYGYTDLYGGHQGGQAEYVRVPFADANVWKVPDGVPDEKVLFLTDILPTGWAAVDQGRVEPGDVVVVFGCGPVGIMAMKSAWVKQAARVIAVDPLAYRRDLARNLACAEVIDPEAGDAIEQIRALTGGRGADVAIDAVGMEVDRTMLQKAADVLHLQAGSAKVVDLCYRAARRGGRVSIVGVYGTAYDNFPLGRFFDKGLTVWAGQAPVHRYLPELARMVLDGRLVTDDVITHRMKLADLPRAYQVFNDKQDGMLKAVFTP